MRSVKVFLIDDHKLFVEGLTSILKDKSGLKVMGFAFSAAEYLDIADTVQADVFLVDVNMPQMSGIELTRLIKEKNPQAKILALSMYEDSHYIEKMIQSGASGYMLKSANIKEMVEAIKKVAKGERYLGDEVQKAVFEKMGSMDFFEAQNETNTYTLSKREKEILALVVREYTTQQIAEKLFISELTVETHRKNIWAKTKTKSIVGLVKFAIREGLVDY
ncbi:MAG: DNA-binding response regulator [Bacteroidetes bacterium]|nr:MAG: DNA-binding response regulator [Bacteroidota bacterium]